MSRGNHESEAARYARARAIDPTILTAGELLVLLGDRSWRVRKAALERLRRMPQRPELIPHLVAALGDADNAGLRSACAEALGAFGEAAISELLRALSTSDADRRKFVVEVLGGIGTPSARERLLAALDDPDENVRSAVIEALAPLGGEETIAVLEKRLEARADDVQLTAYALGALAQLEAKLPFARLAPLLKRSDLARLTYPLLGLSGDERAIAPLVEVLASSSRGSRSVAVRALARLGDVLGESGRAAVRDRLAATAGAIRGLEEALSEEDEAVAESAVDLLGLLGDPQKAPLLIAAAASRPFIKAAVIAVRTMGPSTVPHLLAALDTASTEARVLALEVIESLGNAEAVPKLLAVAQGVEPRAAEAAVSALGKLGGADCIEPLMRLVREGDLDVVRQTALALAAIGTRLPDAVAEPLRAALAAGDVLPVWLVVLGLIGRQGDCEALVTATHHRDPEVRRAALEALGAFGEAVEEEVLILALTDENAGVRAAAARALGAHPTPRVRQALVVAIADASPLVVAASLQALGQVGGPEAIATLFDAAGSSEPLAAIAALQGLFRLRPPGIVTAVERGLAHADPEVAREAVVLTMRLEPDKATPLLARCLTHRSWHVRLAAAETIANRRLPISDEFVLSQLDIETEPLVREALERLQRSQGEDR